MYFKDIIRGFDFKHPGALQAATARIQLSTTNKIEKYLLIFKVNTQSSVLKKSSHRVNAFLTLIYTYHFTENWKLSRIVSQ